ncbi:isoprenoid synthase domain-containing protein [Xylariaceae sp. FL0662B]|nr:isoprenoid synthase domain-containing protein [Xylariaceae sp. FL0662B]
MSIMVRQSPPTSFRAADLQQQRTTGRGSATGISAPVSSFYGSNLSLSGAKRQRLESADFGLFTALGWPEASLERFETLASLVIWLFAWDDEIDEPTGAYSENMSGAQTYREQTLRFVENCMGLIPHGTGGLRPQNGIVQSFDVVGAALRANYDASQLQRFRNEIGRFMEQSEVEQRGRLRGDVASIEEYWAFRLGTSAVYIGSAAGEYSIAARLPSAVMDGHAMRALWDETNVIISITNDLLSLRKEISLDCIDSIVPLTFTSTNDLQEAMALSVAALRTSKERFDEAAKVLLAGIGERQEVYRQVLKFIQVQRSNCVGNLVWSLETQRYGVSGSENKDRSLRFTL